MHREALDLTSCQIISAACKVHSRLGPGLLESAYEACLTHELRQRGFRVALQVPQPVMYEGLQLELGYRIDMLVEDAVVVELKAVSKLASIHHAQVLSYLKLGGFRLGLLINFAERHLRDGIVRLVNDY